MATDPEQLKSTLDALHQELAGIDELDPALRDKLTAALQEIQAALRSKKPPSSESTMRRLGEAARHFEESHPALAGSIGSLIDALGRGGI